MEALAAAGKHHHKVKCLAELPDDGWVLVTLWLIEVTNTESARPAVIEAVHGSLPVLRHAMFCGHVTGDDELASCQIPEVHQARCVKFKSRLADTNQSLRVREEPIQHHPLRDSLVHPIRRGFPQIGSANALWHAAIAGALGGAWLPFRFRLAENLAFRHRRIVCLLDGPENFAVFEFPARCSLMLHDPALSLPGRQPCKLAFSGGGHHPDVNSVNRRRVDVHFKSACLMPQSELMAC